MSTHSRRLSLFVVGAALLVFLVGCGGGDAPLDEPLGLTDLTPEQSVSQAGPDGMVRVVITLQSAAGNADRSMVASNGGRVRHMYRYVHGMSAELPEQAIEALRRNPRVVAVEPAAIMRASDDQVLPWGVERIDDRLDAQNKHLAPDANRGAGVLVAIIDTGIDYRHHDLAPNYNDELGWDYVNDDDDPMDDRGHGTHCAGIVAAADDYDYGVVGVAPDATLCAYKVLGADGSGYEDDLIAALEQCITDGVDVASMSMGSSKASGLLETACHGAYQAGVVLVAAAGNTGRPQTRFDNVQYPARYDSVIAVGATDWGDQRTTWSSTGPALELCAPGNYIFSTYLVGAGDPLDYATMSGTSMACPHVSGAAALAIADGLSSPAAVRVRLTSTADDLGPAGRDVAYGFGLVDADEAAGAGQSMNTAPVVSISAPDDGATFEEGASVSFAGSASDAEDGDLSADLAWTSDRDGQIGTGAGFSAQLSPGEHAISAHVTDSGGLSASDTVTITVTGTSGGGTLAVAVLTDKEVYSSGETVTITVTVTESGTAVSGAAVGLRLTTPKGKVHAMTATSNGSGVAVFTYNTFTRRDGSGTYTAAATASAAGYSDGGGSTTFEAY